MTRCGKVANGCALAALVAGLAACTPPPDDVPYVAYDDTVRLVGAIDRALVADAKVVWRSEASDAHGSAAPGEAYRDRLDRPCRTVTYTVAAADGSFTQSAGYCLTAAGDWVPDLPPGAGSVAGFRDTERSSAATDRALRREMLVEFRRLQRRGDSRAEALRELRKRYSLQERRRAGF